MEKFSSYGLPEVGLAAGAGNIYYRMIGSQSALRAYESEFRKRARSGVYFQPTYGSCFVDKKRLFELILIDNRATSRVLDMADAESFYIVQEYNADTDMDALDKRRNAVMISILAQKLQLAIPSAWADVIWQAATAKDTIRLIYPERETVGNCRAWAIQTSGWEKRGWVEVIEKNANKWRYLLDI